MLEEVDGELTLVDYHRSEDISTEPLIVVADGPPDEPGGGAVLRKVHVGP